MVSDEKQPMQTHDDDPPPIRAIDWIDDLRRENRELRAEVERLKGRRFPIMGGPSIPWSMIGPHDRQAKSNHGGQDLERLADRGGLGCCEALAVLDGIDYLDSPWRSRDREDKRPFNELERRRAKYEDDNCTLRTSRNALAAALERIRDAATTDALYQSQAIARAALAEHGPKEVGTDG